MMLKVWCGSDTVKVRQTAFALVSEKEAKGVTVTFIDGDNFTPGLLADAAGATSLFGGEELYVLDTPSTNKEFEEEVKDSLEALKESPNTFVVIEGGLLAAPKKKYLKYAETLEEFSGKKEGRFDVFAFADLLAKKDKKALWLHLYNAWQEKIPTEEIIGIMWWQLKSLRLAAATSSASEAGMKDFPYNKAKRSLITFKDNELEQISHNLLAVYHDGHGGIRDIDLALEEWILTL